MNEKFAFSWKNLTVWYIEKQDGKHSRKILLNNVSGSAYSGSLVAIMGLSGVGKTSFLASLSGKNKEKEGLILFNNYIADENYLKHLSNYVYQTDILMQSLTVLEHMKFMSAFKLRLSSSKDTLNIINNILFDLNLENSKDTQLKHLSGGERKRVALGVELLNDPLILFCDEPTTGLDSSSAVMIIQMLQNRVMKNRLIIITIHQPSSQIFDYFSDIILLANGEIFYQGKKEAIAEHFESLKLFRPINYNPAEFYIKCLTNNGAINGVVSSKILYNNKLFLEKPIQDLQESPGDRCNEGNFCHDLYWLIWRILIDTKRNFGYHIFQFSLLMTAALLIASFYSCVEIDSESSVQNIRGVLFFFTTELIFTHTYSVVNTFPEEYSIFLREKPLYSVHTYFISKILSIFPRNVIQPFLFLTINFLFLTFLNGFTMLMQTSGIMICACMSGTMLGLCISAIFTSLEYMDLFIAPFEVLTMIAAGILINVESLAYFNWIKYISPFYYTYESLSITYWTRVKSLDCNNNSTICYRNGKEVLKDLGFYTEEIYIIWNIIYMFILTFIIGLIALFALLHKRNKHCSY